MSHEIVEGRVGEFGGNLGVLSVLGDEFEAACRKFLTLESPVFLDFVEVDTVGYLHPFVVAHLIHLADKFVGDCSGIGEHDYVD